MYTGVPAQLLSRVWLFVNPWTLGRQAPLSMWFSRQEYLDWVAFPSPGNLPHPGIELASPALAGGFFTTEPYISPLMWSWSLKTKTGYWLCHKVSVGHTSRTGLNFRFSGLWTQSRIQLQARKKTTALESHRLGTHSTLLFYQMKAVVSKP